MDLTINGNKEKYRKGGNASDTIIRFKNMMLIKGSPRIYSWGYR